MSSIPFDPGRMGRAEKRFRDAFDRLRLGKPEILPKGSKVTQNNVAREAGVDPSALRACRYPTVVAAIQLWVKANGGDVGASSPRQTAMARRARNRNVREKLTAVVSQRDDALSKAVDTDAALLELITENKRLREQQPDKRVTLLRPVKTRGPDDTKS